MHLRMSFGTVFAGAVLMVMTSVFMTVGLSSLSFQPSPSDIARPLTADEEKGRQVYISNGCVYCHTQYIRPQDWNAAGGGKAARVAQAGDYVFLQTMLLGSERTGPDLSQEGGVHPDDWHLAHFQNPRFTSPQSIMPQFNFLSVEDRTNLIKYVQSLGGKAADVRMAIQSSEKDALVKSLNGGQGDRSVTDPKKPYDQAHLDYLMQQVPTTWKNTRSAMPPSNRSIVHGKQIFLSNCVGCHGYNGDGNGPAAQYMQPRPFNFTDVAAQKVTSEGQYYHFLLFGLPGSAMPAWGDFLTVNDIWDVINFIRTIPNGGLTIAEDKLDASLQVTGPNAGPEPSQYDANQEFWSKNPPNPVPTVAPDPNTSGGR
ncbi:MAG: cbb3-type cytochrome c oxidase subunit II [Chloroflexi bacterium]|uniref:Cbb3-type cytochrome c oxidase subunit II n=1 Tax=Candidatus Chlorohelix allophototropha TaxID=3003348 RepID=A0A8T7M3G4_9CHLR|nr:cbb3-type cytochrome c oxidase subunit II [Chloroflexota bacterium]WJW67766.1 cbb3-type cytochrome c oxidase subunit II [Chloroflexota bacterium L227-S17]